MISAFTEFYRVFTRFFIEFYWFSPSVTEFLPSSRPFTELYRVLPSFLSMISGFYRVLPSFPWKRLAVRGPPRFRILSLRPRKRAAELLVNLSPNQFAAQLPSFTEFFLPPPQRTAPLVGSVLPHRTELRPVRPVFGFTEFLLVFNLGIA